MGRAGRWQRARLSAALRQDSMQITPPKSRNDPCPCGSGDRYKHCHGLEGIAPAPQKSVADQTLSLMHRALAAQRAGQLAQAGALYDQALLLDPLQVDALHMRGVVALSEGDTGAAIKFIEAARSLGLDTVETRHNLALATDAARAAKAAVLLVEASQLEPPPDSRFIAPESVQLLAYYLPQFHAIPENDRWWGTGFTEWTNVRRATPNFPGHDQPRVPADLGYYSLLDAAARDRQAELARAHGVTGFCYYHYWFKGQRLLEAPINEMLRSGKPDFPFCVFWANENWTKRWDGGNNELLIGQSHDADDDRRFIEHLLPFFEDSRYIRILGRPLLMIYKFDQFANPRQTIARWAEVCAAHGVARPYVVAAETTTSGAPQIYAADASVEFPPHRLPLGSLQAQRPADLHPEFSGSLLDYRAVAAWLATAREPAYRHFRTVLPGWDNTARRQRDGSIFVNSSPSLFRAWLRDSFVRAEEMLPPGERIVFVNAWNEWAEGAYLEPDKRHGLSYLQAALDARHVANDHQRFSALLAAEFAAVKR